MISESRTGNHSDCIRQFYPVRYNSNLLKMRTSWYLYQKINFKLPLREKCPNTELFQVRIFLFSDWIRRFTFYTVSWLIISLAHLGEQTFLKWMCICFSQPLALSPIFPATAQYNATLSTLVFLLLQKSESTLHVRYCCVIRAWSSDFNPSSYLQLWIGCVHQSYTPGTFLGDYFLKE